MLPKRDRFPILNKLHNLRHIVHDLKGSGLKDPEVVLIAKNQGRILISKNDKHMVELCKIGSVRLICITESMPDEEVDKKVASELAKWTVRKTVVKISHSPRKK